jgi:diguanylate cyclase (GGDEF)-like protein/PAS domain S-box-containing protein
LIFDMKNRKKDINKMICHAIEQGPIAVIITDKEGNIEYVNARFSELTGYSSNEVIGKNPRLLKSDEHSPEFYKELWDTITSGKVWKGDLQNKKKNGELYWEDTSISPVTSNGGNITHFIAVKNDISERRKMEEELKNIVGKDSLTQTYNRSKFKELFNKEIARFSRYSHPFSLILLDIDFFKSVNDTYGHITGDNILKSVSRIIQKCIRETDSLIRWGGEEFIIIASATDLEKAIMLAERIRKTIENHSFDVVRKLTISFGVSSFRSGDSKDSIVKRADDAMYQAKRNGRNRVEAIS